MKWVAAITLGFFALIAWMRKYAGIAMLMLVTLFCVAYFKDDFLKIYREDAARQEAAEKRLLEDAKEKRREEAAERERIRQLEAEKEKHRLEAERKAATQVQKQVSDKTQLTSKEIEIVAYEAVRAGLDPSYVRAVIWASSENKRNYTDAYGRIGLMGINKQWASVDIVNDALETISHHGSDRNNFFDTRTNIRIGCMALRHFIDQNKGDIVAAALAYRSSNATIDSPYGFKFSIAYNLYKNEK